LSAVTGASASTSWRTQSSIARSLRTVDVAEKLIPAGLITDNGPEFAGRALDAWAYAQGIRLHFIEPGKPNQNAYVESFRAGLLLAGANS
jgi:transposase InsO family protein